MTDAEALMWNVEKDPWLNPNGGVVLICDGPIDPTDFARRIAFAVAEVPRLRAQADGRVEFKGELPHDAAMD